MVGKMGKSVGPGSAVELQTCALAVWAGRVLERQNIVIMETRNCVGTQDVEVEVRCLGPLFLCAF